MEFDSHQQEALNKLKSGSILVGGTGTGKSRTALAYYYIRECKGSISFNGEGSNSPMKDPKPLYIITTAAKRDRKEWEKELIPFSISEAVIDSWNNISKYVAVKDSFFIFDEQRVVGSGAWSKSFLKIVKFNRWILLSATPGDTWSDYIPVFIANGFFKNRTEFCTKHVVWSRYTTYPKIESYLREDELVELRESILVKMEIKKKTTPHKIFEEVDYDKDLYFKVVKERWNIFEDTPIENASQYCQVLRKIVNSDISRCEKIRELMKRHDRAIIFYNFDYEREALLKLAKEMYISVAEWNGHNHEQIPNEKEWLYLVQYNAGAEGWECTQTDTIIFYSLSYSYRMTCQAEGRIDRRNTNFLDLYYYYLISKSPLDSLILKSLKNKRDFNALKYYISETSQEKQSLL